MTLLEVIIKERERYVVILRSGIDHQKALHEIGWPEVLLAQKTEENKNYPEVFQLYTFDFVHKNPDGSFGVTEFNLEDLLNYEEEEYFVGRMKVTVNPFFWNGCELLLYKEIQDWNAFNEWLVKWVDEEDKIKKEDNGIMGTIHNSTFPEKNGNSWTVSIDFGSAPVNAFMELLSLFESQGITSVAICSKLIQRTQ